MMHSPACKTAARQFINFINKSPSPYHAVEECKKSLREAGFRELKETEKWNLSLNDKCFVTRNQSSIIAFAVGGQYKAGNGFSIVGAHTDSPCLKLKPFSGREAEGYLLLGVETYGGGLWPTWFDRDLKVAGRAMVKTPSGYTHKLVHIDRPLIRVPNICIHFQRDHGTEFHLNKEEHLTAVLATDTANTSSGMVNGVNGVSRSAKRHHPVIMKLIADECQCDVTDLRDAELVLADCQPATLGGPFEEFVFAARMDNLISCYTSLTGLIESCHSGRLSEDENIRMITLFDNEEVGSNSAQGAGSSLTELILRRIIKSLPGGEENSQAYEQAIPKSLVLSCDVAHAIHPNYRMKHEWNHKPAFHKGMVIKINSNQRYATTAITSTILKDIAEKANLPLQEFVMRQDMACGSTIGPITSAKLGIPVIDIGPPLLSMHSIREQMDTTSVADNTALFKAFFDEYAQTYKSIEDI